MHLNKRAVLFALTTVLLLFIVPLCTYSQSAPATSVAGYPGAGVIQAGDLWESFLPEGTTASYSDIAVSTLGYRNFIRLGNFDRNWTTPGTHWPNAYPYTTYWFKNAAVLLFDPDPTFNPPTIGGKSNPSFYSGGGGTYYAQLTFGPALSGASDPTRHYTVEPYWVDGTRRQHQVYEAAWPTNAGIDVKIRAHGFQGPNWNNMNDFVILEIELKNTGDLDMDMDGVAEKVGNQIKALAFHFSTESYMSVSSYGVGGRNGNNVVPIPLQRQAAWIDDPDPSGSPWAFSTMLCSASALNPTAGNVDMGFNTGTLYNYTDVWTGMVMIDVKGGALPADRSKTVVSNPSKKTIFGTDGIGVGPERGWYVSGGSQSQVWTLNNPMAMFLTATGVWFQDGGKTRTTDIYRFNLSPNPNFFSGGTAGDITTFVPKSSGRTRPDGDFKSSGIFDAPSYEDGKADASTVYPTGWGKFSKGASNTENFNGDMFAGVGPFSLGKDSSMTIVMATVAGYRLEGIQKAVRAARWAYAQNYNIPLLPPMPEMKVSKPLSRSIAVEWDDRAESDAAFAGYKVYRSSQYQKKFYLDEGMRVVDRYQENMTPGPIPTSLKKAVNPKFDAFGQVNSTTAQGSYQPDTWGTWDLIAVVPKAMLGIQSPAVTAGYKYLYEDKDIATGYSYWYYVAAYKEGVFSGPDNESTTRLETHSTNRNGASGLWNLTFPFAPLNANYPKDAAGLKAIGAAVTRNPFLAVRSLGFGTVGIGETRKVPFALSNPSDYTMRISGVTSSNAAFSVTTPVLSIAPGQSVIDTLVYVPTRQGTDSALVLIFSNAIPGTDTLVAFGVAQRSGYQATAAWSRSLDSVNMYGTAAYVAADAGGNVFLAGMTRTGSLDYLTLMKYGPSGDLQWIARDSVVGPLPNMGSLALDRGGNAYVTGMNYATIKYNSLGSRQWRNQYADPTSLEGLSVAQAIAVDSSGNVYISGTYVVANNYYEIVTIKYTPSGSREWVAVYNGPDNRVDSIAYGVALALDAAGNVYVAGTSMITTQKADIVVIKYANNGVQAWVNRYNGPKDSTDTARSIAVDAAGSVYVTGSSVGVNSGFDLVTIKYSTDGTRQWVARYDGPNHGWDGGSKVALDKFANVYVTGYTLPSNQQSDIVTIKYNSAGALQWFQRYDGPVGMNDSPSGLIVDAAANVYVTGSSIGVLSKNEFITIRYDSSGREVWEARYGDGNTDHYASSIALDGSGNVLVGGIRLTGSGSASYRNLVVKYGQSPLSAVGFAEQEQSPRAFGLEQNYPNPFNPSTVISFRLSGLSRVTLTVFDVLGREVEVLVDGTLQEGSYKTTWNASKFPSGVYFYRLRARSTTGGFVTSHVDTKKLILLR